MKELILIGGGGHARSCIDVIELEKKYKIIGILDNNLEIGATVLNYKVLGDDSTIAHYIEQECYFLITVGQIQSNTTRVNIYDKLILKGAKLATVISPRAYISPYSHIEQGTIIMHDVLINANVTIGANCIINTKALIEHDVQIEKHSHISTRATINGADHIEQGCFIGSGAVTKEGITITQNSFIKAGSVVK